MNRDQASSDELFGVRKAKEIIYVVKEGDTLWGIAKKYNITIAEIKTWNHLNETDRIYPADKLKLRVGEGSNLQL